MKRRRHRHTPSTPRFNTALIQAALATPAASHQHDHAAAIGHPRVIHFAEDVVLNICAERTSGDSEASAATKTVKEVVV